MGVVTFLSRGRLAVCGLVVASVTVAAFGAGTVKKKPQTTHVVAKKAAGKRTAGKKAIAGKTGHGRAVVGKKSSSKKAGAFRQSFVPVPAARPVGHAPMIVADPYRAAVTAASGTTQESGVAVPPPSATVPEGVAQDVSLGTESVAGELQHGASALKYPGALRKYFAALRAEDGTTVRALQFGDSHTAADMMSGEMRAQIQGRFGNGGVGFTYAGHPFAGYRILGSGRGQSGGWQTLGTHFTQLGDGLLGMGGVAIEASRGGESAQLTANCRTLQVDFLRRPGGGSFEVVSGGLRQQQVFTDTLQTAPATTLVDGSAGQAATAQSAGPVLGLSSAGQVVLSCTAGINDFQFVTNGDGPVRLLGTTALEPGATWEGIGINGAEAPLILRWDAGMFDSYLQRAAPQLIVLAYGTNEAAGRWTGAEYAVTFARLVDHLHTLAPGASILVVGPGDRAIAQSHVTVTGSGRHARRHVTRSYVPYVGTARILNAQREVCRTHDCAFWDWQQRQGGFGSVGRWVSAGYAQPDHTHLTGTGYRALADALFADLMAAYEAGATSNVPAQ